MFNKLPLMVSPNAKVVNSGSSMKYRILIPEETKPLLDLLFKRFNGALTARVISSGYNWVELSSRVKGVGVTFYTNTETKSRLDAGYDICFNDEGQVNHDAVFVKSQGKKKPIW